MYDNMQKKQLRRIRDGRMVAGVCTGLADYFSVDVTLVRLVFALLTIFGGAGALFYLVAWLILPEEDEPASIAENMINKQRS
jgi:phage shock protein PspC (stress-responsive transcriptional regulator)